MKQEDQNVLKMLPEAPRNGMRQWIMDHSWDELGGDVCLYHRESFLLEPELRQTMLPEDWETREKETVRRWGAACTCTACGEEFSAGWVSDSGITGIRLWQGG